MKTLLKLQKYISPKNDTEDRASVTLWGAVSFYYGYNSFTHWMDIAESFSTCQHRPPFLAVTANIAMEMQCEAEKPMKPHA